MQDRLAGERERRFLAGAAAPRRGTRAAGWPCSGSGSSRAMSVVGLQLRGLRRRAFGRRPARRRTARSRGSGCRPWASPASFLWASWESFRRRSTESVFEPEEELVEGSGELVLERARGRAFFAPGSGVNGSCAEPRCCLEAPLVVSEIGWLGFAGRLADGHARDRGEAPVGRRPPIWRRRVSRSRRRARRRPPRPRARRRARTRNGSRRLPSRSSFSEEKKSRIAFIGLLRSRLGWSRSSMCPSPKSSAGRRWERRRRSAGQRPGSRGARRRWR